MINLMDTYNQASWDLHYSLVKSGYDNPTIALNDDGFLPEDVTSPYQFYTDFVGAKGHALYFNQVPVPEFWEIRGDGSQAEIFDYEQKRGQIHYAEPLHQRLVKAVDWLDKAGRIRVTDHYNKCGFRHAQTTYNTDGQPVLKTYYNKSGKEVLVENATTGDIILNDDNQVHIFHDKVAFVTHYLKTSGYNLDRIIYNSLSTPFLVAFYLGGQGEDLLFWQEPIYGEIPGNMQLLLNNQGRPTRIMVQDKETYDKMLPLLTPEQAEKVSYLGYLYPFRQGQLDLSQALILTNSDQLEQIDQLLEQQPQLTFHIGALTEMSERLTRLASLPNVILYPNITINKVQELYQQCGLYLDINHQGEILSAVRAAFEKQLLILGFQNTVHNRAYTMDDLIVPSGDASAMNGLLDQIAQSSDRAQALLEQQKAAANLTTEDQYRRLIG